MKTNTCALVLDDRELLELAALAMGYGEGHWEDGSWLEVRYGLTCAWWSDKMHDEYDEGYWNPLESDSQAFRLSVKLDIRFRQHHALVTADYPMIDEEFNTRKVLCEGVFDDYCAATRRAVVRAAAEMGKKVDAPQNAG